MWFPKRLELQNFISHKNSTYIFNKGVSEVIVGMNKDDESQESNGSGKSGISEGCVFALTGDPFRKVKAVDLIMNNCNHAVIEFEMENPSLNENMIIRRVIERKKSSSITINVNGVDKTNFVSVNDANKFIIDKLDISREDLMNYFMVSKDRYVSFLLSSDTKKKEIISRFSGANLTDGADDLVEEDVEGLQDQISEVEKQIYNNQGRLSVYQDELGKKKTKKQQEDEKKVVIEELNKRIGECNESSRQCVEVIEEARRSITIIDGEIKKFDVSKFEKKLKDGEKSEKDLREIIKETKSTLEEYDQTIADINRNLKDVIECPKCHHEFSLKSKDFNVEEAKVGLIELKDEQVKLVAEVTEKNSELKKLDSLRTEVQLEIRKIQNKKIQAETDRSRLVQKSNAQESQIDSYKRSVEHYTQEIQKVKSMIVLDDSGELQKNISELQKKLLELEAQKTELEEKKEKTLVWVMNFKKFRTWLANQSIKSIESFTNFYLSKIKTNLNVKIDGYKLLSTGQLKDNITVDVLRNGIVEGAFEKFSGGERVRIDICVILCLQKLINLNSKTGGLDLLFLDEIIESVDSTGVSEILKQLDTLKSTVRIITHASQVREFDKKTVVIKENGCSTINQ